MKTYTIKDIAQLAGVSKGTVDRVIHKRGKVSETAYKKVSSVLKEIDYVPNPIARNLKRNKTYTICILLPFPKSDSYWLPCGEAFEESEKTLRIFGIVLKILYFDPQTPKSFTDCCKSILLMHPDAVLLASLFYKETKEAISQFLETKIKVSTINNRIIINNQCNFVGQNLFKSGRIAGKLMEMITDNTSKTAIIHIDEVYNNAYHMQEKEKGFRDFFSNNTTRKFVTISSPIDNLETNLDQLFKENPLISGCFITNSKTHLVAKYKTLNRLNFKIIGYDLIEKNIGYLKNHNIDFLIHQNPKMQAQLAINYLSDYFLYNKEILKEKLLAIDIINCENVDEYIN